MICLSKIEFYWLIGLTAFLISFILLTMLLMHRKAEERFISMQMEYEVKLSNLRVALHRAKYPWIRQAWDEIDLGIPNWITGTK